MEFRWRKTFGNHLFLKFGRGRESSVMCGIFVLMMLFCRAEYAFGACLEGVGVDGYKLVGCKVYSDSTVSILDDSIQGGRGGNFDFMPFYVVFFKEGVEPPRSLAADGNWNELGDVSLPYKNQIDEHGNLSDQAARRLSLPGWSVAGEVFVYHASVPQIGMIVVCARALRNLSKIHIAVYHCSSFYEGDLENFKKALRHVESSVELYHQ
ncbi:hypothetical protein ACN8ZM_36150 [Burkholderia aenigmatica]|uniref:hypothetical protein n=1 Tax=Burkholderia aenigmatica TaxID=2015348 RepID=UPI003B42A2BE